MYHKIIVTWMERTIWQKYLVCSNMYMCTYKEKKNIRTVVSDIFYFDLVTINATWIELEYTCTNTAF